MKRCPKCNRIYSDLTLNFCLEDGTALSDHYGLKANALNFKTTEPVFHISDADRTDMTRNHPGWNLLLIGLSLCLLSGVSISVVSGAETKRLLKQQTVPSYNVVLVLLVLILLLGMCLSLTNLKKSSKR